MFKLLLTIRVILLLMAFPVILCAQNPTNALPQNNRVRDTARKKDLLDVAKSLFHIHSSRMKENDEPKISFSLLPIGNAPAGDGRAVVTSTTANIYLGPKNTTNRSTATFAPYWNLKKRFGLPLRSNLWFPKNQWFLQGDMRFLIYPQYTWGLGSKNNYSERTLVDYRYIRFYETGYKRLGPRFFAGIGYNLDYRFHIQSADSGIYLPTFTNYVYGTNASSLSSGITLNLLYDTRNNSAEPLPGVFANLVYRMNPTVLGNKNYWSSLYLDVRKYISMNKDRPYHQNTLALWAYLWTVFNNTVPYLDLPSTGWDPNNRSARGFDQNRYRGKTLFNLEGEYRGDITYNSLLGFVVFANVNTVSGSGSLFTSWHPAAGAGLRIKFSKISNTNIGIDFGLSKGYKALIVNLNEAF